MANTVTLLCMCLIVVSSIHPSHSNCPTSEKSPLCSGTVRCCDELTKSPNCATPRDDLWKEMLCSPGGACGDNALNMCCLSYYIKFGAYPRDGSCHHFKNPTL
ncbi:hypothetical protein SNE40_011434 [Patella caerulea]|uniref:Uncharacterized protein n=1 Tax=Patella caerulea TaxID=87958 RepID=A0AAN8JJV5_PATCE